MTNFEKIKSMTLEEMANFLKSSANDFFIILGGETILKKVDYIKEWLEREVKE